MTDIRLQAPNLPSPSDIIPHRDPRLYLSGLTALEPGVSAAGFWLPHPERDFEGHFDGMPVLQAVMQVESLAQLGACAVMIAEPNTVGVFESIKEASFKRPVKPGDMLDLTIQIIDRTKRGFTGSGVITVDGLVTCEATISGVLMLKAVAQKLLGNKT